MYLQISLPRVRIAACLVEGNSRGYLIPVLQLTERRVQSEKLVPWRLLNGSILHARPKLTSKARRIAG